MPKHDLFRSADRQPPVDPYVRARDFVAGALASPAATFIYLNGAELIRQRLTDGWPGTGREHVWNGAVSSGTEGPPFVVSVPGPQYQVVHVLASYGYRGQFSVDTEGSVFTHNRNGWSTPEERVVLDGVSELLDTVAVLFHHYRMLKNPRGVQGGRFHFRADQVLDANGDHPVVDLRVDEKTFFSPTS